MKGEVRSPVVVILLSIITCGIYSWVWLYSIGNELKNYLNDENSNPSMDLVLSIFCFPYMIYLLYKYSRSISDAQGKAGIVIEDNAIIVLLLSIFGFGIVAVAIMQNSLNKVWQADV